MAKFICKISGDCVVKELSEKEILSIQTQITILGDAILVVNYYDFETCLNSTLYCCTIDVKE